MKHIFVFMMFIMLIAGCSEEGTVSEEDDSPESPILPHTKWALDPENPVLEGTASWENSMVTHPTVIMLKDTLRMWYEGGRNEYRHIVDIGYAWSLDGVNWKKETGNPVLSARSGQWDYPHVLHPIVIVDEDTLRMWYGGGDFALAPMHIGYAVSTDGINWNRYQDPVIITNKPWNKDGAIPGAVIKEGSIFKMWFTAGVKPWPSHSLDVKWSIGYAVSPDGVNWTVQDEPVLAHGANSNYFDFNIVACGTVLKSGAGYEMWYNGGRFINGLPLLSKIAYATSTDGINWKKYERNPVLSLDEAQPGFGKDFFTPSVVKVGDIYHMWFAAWHSGDPTIGHATSVN